MKLTGLGALACAAALTLACAGDTRNEQDNEASRSGTIYGGDATPDQTAELEGPGDSEARIGAAGEDPSSVATGTSGQAGIREAATTTRQFVEKAAIAGTAEIELGQLASERAQHADVKAFGQIDGPHAWTQRAEAGSPRARYRHLEAATRSETPAAPLASA